MKREKTMNRVKNIIGIAAFSLMVLGLPAIASAQYGYPNGYPNDPYGRNGGYNNGGYGNGQYGGYGDQASMIRKLKNHTRYFHRQLDRDLDRSRMNGTRREDQINEAAKRFRDAVNDLDNNGYSNSNNNGRYNNRNDNEMRRVFDQAAQIERAISRADVSYNTRNLWSAVRNDLQSLSRGNNNNGRGNNNGSIWGNGNGNGNGNRNGNRNGLPSWWPF